MHPLCQPGQPMMAPSSRSNQWFLWLTHALLLAALAVSPHAKAEDNPYSSHYQAQNEGNHLHSLQANPEPQMFSGTHRAEDNIRMLENGYDLMGFSSFEAGEVDAAQALDHGRNIQADNILVYMKKGGGASPASKMEVIKEAVKKGQTLTEKDMATTPGNYRYYASYWAKLPPPLLGIHVIKLVPKKSAQDDDTPHTANSDGVRVIAVIHGSAAEKSGVLRGDQLLSINHEKVDDAAQLSSVVRKYRGKAVTLQLERQGEPLALDAQL
ncbi:PDZ domain-containing protein [Methylophilus sp. 5]|uniref:PDZ domain-containing protein n=1 Tax=Methylophilus sp. 5 TaxID=1112274 RepID=UPI001E429CE2|nr:PDZ domain-containing protein [Methylophilus sp. 5]